MPMEISRRATRGLGRRSRWIAVAVAIAVAGTVAALLGAASLARSDARQSRARLRSSAAVIAATVNLGIKREQDLLVSAAAAFRGSPDQQPSVFWQWTSEVHAFQRYPELVDISLAALVPRHRLAAFERERTAAPAYPRNRAPFMLIPTGSRPLYCFLRASVGRYAAPPGVDLCTGNGLLVTRDTGASSAYPVEFHGVSVPPLFGESVPVYRGTPRTVAARRASFLGWVVSLANPAVLLDQALVGHPGVRVSLQRGLGVGIRFSAGRAPAGSAVVRVDLGGGSRIQVFGAVTSAGIFTISSSASLLLGGTMLSILLSVLMYVLATGRTRALQLVDEKTEQLSFQALHDGLTQLPNRVLVLDRTRQALARARRTHQPASVLFIDIDGFKGVNDTHGHAAGDQLLRVIGGRLTNVVRESDTVGRLGGDEFVALLETNDAYIAPELVAERIIDVLAQPIEVEDGKTVAVSASVGIASGDRETAGDLLRDADLALYAAKSAGKNRYVFFEDSMHNVAAPL